MNFIEALKLRSKLLFIFILIAVGLFFLGIMGTINLNSMKKNLDSLYFGSLVPVIELNSILQIYHSDLAHTIYRAKNSEITRSEVESKIQNSVNSINREWKKYESHFKRDKEFGYVEYTALEVNSTNQYFYKILKALSDGHNIKDISILSLEKKISHIHKVLNKLIAYEVGVAKYERKKFLEVYDSLLLEVSFILSIVIFGVMLISYYVFKSIQKDQTALEIATKRLKVANKKLENVSYTDSLTNLYNRRYFNLVYDRELKRAKRNHTHITFMMLDIDFFKQYNDTYGHIEGDFALKSVAKVLQDTLKRPGDFVFRLGGEEFGILLTETDESNSANLARDICDSVRGREIKHSASKANEFVTISIGVVCCIADEALNDEILLSRADEMLYKAKDSGRDRYNITTDISEAKTVKVKSEEKNVEVKSEKKKEFSA
ncbi:diguanylate cyclase [Candidatus Sulfurimonas marisnigri]|uniref:diguanylate cyclase n=1 Tax=Candidatus Sulfurimonas marisnigri TaxID=2740405 RepID=A0A7S7RP90_9BACT|nr:diguanylate cyclase [Candidatus Sulfurimonas marisnigri]QOY54132.1 diguanylate cyclase [Candidatus Sulfurimonas marisnigri]